MGERTKLQGRLRWHLHALDPEIEVPPRALDRALWLDRVGERLGPWTACAPGSRPSWWMTAGP